MLETLVVILLVLWLLGFMTSYTMGGLVHLLWFRARGYRDPPGQGRRAVTVAVRQQCGQSHFAIAHSVA
jgi:hypothetical protein